MTQPLFSNAWLVNTLLDEGFVARKCIELAKQPVPYDLNAWLAAHFDVASLSRRSEAQLEERFIGPLLTAGQDNALIASKDHALITAMATKRPEYLALLQ